MRFGVHNIGYLFRENYNVRWLRYLAILYPEMCLNAGSPWELFQKLFITETGVRYVRGYQLENGTSEDTKKALRAVLSHIRTAGQLRDCVGKLGALAVGGEVEVLLREAKIRLGFPVELQLTVSSSILEVGVHDALGTVWRQDRFLTRSGIYNWSKSSVLDW
jgi:hypothetical protein